MGGADGPAGPAGGWLVSWREIIARPSVLTAAACLRACVCASQGGARGGERGDEAEQASERASEPAIRKRGRHSLSLLTLDA
mmetsp:Transcript_4520/g.16206  ORF Transcript_4520/g.16206 Transcript_4520/m.16206 type:complete len:82 (-) Transcript_4520:1135-1380(-)|eukprot:scaffold370_cov289-Prasinococcus_capsulatus_cf.AAC.19